MKAHSRNEIASHPLAQWRTAKERPGLGSLLSLGGAGSVLTHHIILQLMQLNAKKTEKLGGNRSHFNMLGQQWASIVEYLVQDALAGTRFKLSLSTLGYENAVAIFRLQEKVSALVYGISWPDFWRQNPYPAHRPPSPDTGAWLKKRGYRFVHVRRPLLGMLLSTSNKVAPTLGEDKFSDLRWFRFMANVNAYATGLMEQSGTDDILFRYVELLQNPESSIQQLGESLGLSCSAAQAQDIWQALAFRQLEGAPDAHFQGGGVGKWSKYITPDHIAILDDLGLGGWLELEEAAPGYRAPTDASEWLRQAGVRLEQCGESRWRAGLSEHSPIAAQPPGISLEEIIYTVANIGDAYMERVGNHTLAANTPELLDHFKERMQQDPRLAVLQAAGLGE